MREASLTRMRRASPAPSRPLECCTTAPPHGRHPNLPGLEPFRPTLRYHLVDEARLKLHPMAEVRNLAEALFGVEQSRTLKNTLDIMRTLDAMPDDPQIKPLRRTIST